MVQSMQSQFGTTEQVNQNAEEIRRSFESHESHTRDLMCYLRDYANDNPSGAAMWCFGIGFVLGWKLKPW